MTVYLLSQVFTFIVCSLLATTPTNKSKCIANILTILVNIFGIVLFTLQLIYVNDGKIWTFWFNIPTLSFTLFYFPILIILNFITLIYIVNSFADNNNIQDNILIIALVNFHNFLLTTVLFARELITIFFILEFISLVNVGFILSSNNANRKEVAIKYFVQNIVAGMLYIVGLIFFYKNNLSTELIPFIESPYIVKKGPILFSNIEYFLFSLLFFKLGIFPFHSWVADVFEVLNKKLYMIIFSLQKSILFLFTGYFFYIFSTYKTGKEFIFVTAIILFFTILISLAGGIFTRKLPRFLGYSSIYNASFFIGLFLSPFMIENHSYQNFFFISYIFTVFYIFSTGIILNVIETARLDNFESINTLTGSTRFLWIFFVANFLPFPLLLGFFAKIGAIIEIFRNGLYNVGILLAISSVFGIYIYSRLIPLNPSEPLQDNNKIPKTFIYTIALLTGVYLVLNIYVVKFYNFISNLINFI